MKAVQIKEAGGDFEVVDRDQPTPADNEVLIKVEACGICHSDMFVKEGAFPGIEYPRVPGHEVIGIIEQAGSQAAGFKKGQRVGVGWHGGHCFQCEPCRRGDFIDCENAKIAGISYDGGYAEYMVAPVEALAAVPDDLKSEEAAPLLCAGITTFNALRNSPARGGDLVAVQGVGGLGHLAIQYAKKMGFEVAAISSTDEKKNLAKDLGADHFISGDEPAEKLQALGGARVILATAPSAKAISKVVDGLGIDGQLLIVAAPGEKIEVAPFSLIPGRKSIAGWPSGTAIDSEDTLNFSNLSDVKPMIETFPLEKAAEAYDRMMENKARFRVVLTMS
ncbi:MAG: alcohol dehydrogenase [Fulvivirga sp.]|nr:alcohol dehydrogenase [Fulvivirga sp.]